jgi:ectoine hydroxylase-related dioxygenase (phytanoyl-CoA dioxygenase family)
MNFDNLRQDISDNGFAIIKDVYAKEELNEIIKTIEDTDQSKPTFRKTKDLFAIRQFLKEVPQVNPIIFNDCLYSIINNLFGNGYFVVKSIYFDKPEQSNWFVAWHQDLTISVDKKLDLKGYTSWTVKQNQYAVQPPIEILEGNFTVRIHLDNTNANNGALKVIPRSHLKKIHRPENIDWTTEKSTTCAVEKGGIMIMRPLLMHASERTTNDERRRVIHIEFSRAKLPEKMNWSELETL